MDKLIGLDANVLLGVIFSRIPKTSELLGKSDFGLDTELVMSARFLNKKLDFIETSKDQFDFLKKLPPKVYASAITTVVKLIQNEDAANIYFRKIISTVSASANGNEKEIISGMKFDGLDEYYQNTITNRNEGIVEKIVSRLSENKDKTAFIALGAAHLAGEGSVVQRLKEKGYTATRLCQ